MKRNKLLTILLGVSIGCVANINIAVAKTASPKSAQKNVTDSHKKTKTVQKSVTIRKMSEKDITECTRLINKVAQTDRMLQNDAIAIAANNTKIAEHLKKPAEVQLFASDDPVAIAHLTGKPVDLAVSPVVKQIANATKIMPIAITSASSKPIAQLTLPVPALKPIIKPIVPINTPVFVSDKPKNIALLTAKTTTLNTQTKQPTNLSIATVAKPITIKSPPRSQPHIELFAPNTPVNLDHLEGKSASLESIQKLLPTNKSATAQQKNKNFTHQSKKSSSAVVTNTKTKKEPS